MSKKSKKKGKKNKRGKEGPSGKTSASLDLRAVEIPPRPRPLKAGEIRAMRATLGSIAMNAVRTARIELGDVVAVIGLGLVGQLVAQLVRLQGGVAVGIDLNGT